MTIVNARRGAPLPSRSVVLRAAAVAGVSLVAMAFVFGVLSVVLSGSGPQPDEDEYLGYNILAGLTLYGASALAVVVAGAVAAWRMRLPRPLVVGVGGPLVAVALGPAVVVPFRLFDPRGEWEPFLFLVEPSGRWMVVLVVALTAGDAMVAWAVAGGRGRAAATALGLMAVLLGAGALEEPLAERTDVEHYATLGVPLLVPDLADHPVTGVSPEIQRPVDLPRPLGAAPQPTIGVLEVRAPPLTVRVEPPPTAELSCANLFEWSARPGLSSTSDLDVCRELAPGRWLVSSQVTRAPSELIALRPDALVVVHLSPSGEPDADVALLQDAVESLVPTTAERLAALE